MATDEGHETAGQRRVRIALVVGCVLAVVLAALLVPTLASGDLAGTPIDSILPGDRFDDESGAGTGGTGSGFGALNPGDRTGVGGDTGFDNETFGANDTEVHFTVESAEPAYWRTGSYETYTGTGWRTTDATEPLDQPVEPVGLTDGTLEFEITLEEPATAVPTPWQPQRVSGVDSAELTESGAVRAGQLLEEGATVTGVSQLQENDADVLRAAGEDYSPALRDQYTQLPSSTPDRIEVFTDELTADDETPYDAAMTVQNWLRSEKGYSLEANRQSEHMADTFIFEMEEGYCEYFATAMTTMLRSQDIPARYTIGYSTGQPVDENTYEVRGMNAHAWVEVYFPDVGWVKFDPTPGGSRLDTQSSVLDDELDEEFDLQEPGSPGETFEPGEVIDDTDPEDEFNESDGRFDISLNRTAVPGFPVEIQVIEDEEPVPDMVVTVNGEEVGVTDTEGTVVMTVPEADELQIEVQPSVATVDVNEPPTLDRTDGLAPGETPIGDERLFSYGSDRADLPLPAVRGDANETDEGHNVSGLAPVEIGETANTTVDVQREATLSVTGDVLPGETVTVSATVRDVAIPDAAVALDGEYVGTTDENGRVAVTLPDEPGNATLAAERGPVAGEETVTIPGLELSVSSGLLALPFTTATAEVSAGERSVADAPVVVDGEEIGTTGADGSADVRLPLSPSATVEASSYGLRDSETVDGLLLNLALVVVAAGVLAGVTVSLVRRREFSISSIRRGLSTALDRLVTATQLALLGAVRNGGPWLASLPGRVRTAVSHLLDVLRGRRSFADLKGTVLAWFAAKRDLFRRVRPASEPDGEHPEPAVVEGIQRTWDAFLSRVSVDDPAAHTPGELAAHAVEEDGMPAEPVRTLLSSFRAVEYGSRPEREHRDRAERALARLDRAERVDGATDGSDPQEAQPARNVSADGGQEAGERTLASEDGHEPNGGSR